MYTTALLMNLKLCANGWQLGAGKCAMYFGVVISWGKENGDFSRLQKAHANIGFLLPGFETLSSGGDTVVIDLSAMAVYD